MTNDKEIIVVSSCAKCGTALSPNDLICKSCGTAAVAGDAVAVFIPPTEASDKSGISTLKIILIIIGVIVGLGILGLGAIGFIGYRMVKNTHVDPNGRITMNTPVGTMSATPDDSISESDLGVDIYPGAQSTHKGMRMDFPGNSAMRLEFLTSDSPAQVLSFYKSKLGSTAVATSFLGQSTIHLRISKQESVEVKITTYAKKDNGMTRISISRMKKKDS
jgi:hypothetical protein